LEKEVPIKLQKSSRLRIWTGFTLTEVCALQMLSFLLECYCWVKFVQTGLTNRIVHRWHSQSEDDNSGSVQCDSCVSCCSCLISVSYCLSLICVLCCVLTALCVSHNGVVAVNKSVNTQLYLCRRCCCTLRPSFNTGISFFISFIIQP